MVIGYRSHIVVISIHHTDSYGTTDVQLGEIEKNNSNMFVTDLNEQNEAQKLYKYVVLNFTALRNVHLYATSITLETTF